MGESADAELLVEHEVLFLDFLGFAAAVQHWDVAQMEKLVAVLVAIANAQSTFDIEGESQSDGSYKITSSAEITTFSDHIVVSYPLLAKPGNLPDGLWDVVLSGWIGMVRKQMQKTTASIALAGLGIGLLVRGGLSRGKLYHRGRVAVGEAMVDAYRLESQVAQHPRVVVGPRVKDNDRLSVDTDGVRCLDYIGEMIRLAEDRHGDARVWAQDRLAEIDGSINVLRESGQSRAAEKWVYFRDKLQHALGTWN